MFNFFKKKQEPDYDPLNVQVTDLKKGFIFDYDLSQWEVLEEYTYDWGDEFFTKEYKISDGDKTLFLSVEDDDEIEISIHEKIRLSAFEEDIEQAIADRKRPPKKVHCQGDTFTREEESPGYFNDGGDQWVEMISWDYYNGDESKIVTIEQWGEREFEASLGKPIEAFEIHNITPAE